METGLTSKAAAAAARVLEPQLATLQREYNELRREVFEAEQVQRKLAGPRRLTCGGYELISETFASRSVSGDFFCASRLGSTVMFAVGDIAGKGLAAGMWVSHLVSLIRVHAASAIAPAETTAAINEHLLRLQDDVPLTSMFLVKLDTARHQLEYCNAGHPPALLLRRGQVIQLDRGGPVMGALSNARYQYGRVHLERGDALVCYSDGLSESVNQAEEEFGAERVISAAKAAAVVNSESLVFAVLGAVQDFIGTAPRRDDMSLVVMRRFE
jgi:sigma-B regulation protein RsbU (phosphoserine phosphatase)